MLEHRPKQYAQCIQKHPCMFCVRVHVFFSVHDHTLLECQQIVLIHTHEQSLRSHNFKTARTWTSQISYGIVIQFTLYLLAKHASQFSVKVCIITPNQLTGIKELPHVITVCCWRVLPVYPEACQGSFPFDWTLEKSSQQDVMQNCL